jgi:hypothetical protein
MKPVIVLGLVLALFGGLPGWAATITVGNHLLDVNEGPIFSIPIEVSGGEPLAGMTLVAHIGDYNPPETNDVPKFKQLPEATPPNQPAFNPEMLVGTIWDSLHDGGVAVEIEPQYGGRQVFWGSLTLTGGSSTVPAAGVLVNLLIDISDLPPGKQDTWPLYLASPVIDPTELLNRAGPLQPPPEIINGSITLVPEPSICVMLLGLLAAASLRLAWRKRKA